MLLYAAHTGYHFASKDQTWVVLVNRYKRRLITNFPRSFRTACASRVAYLHGMLDDSTLPRTASSRSTARRVDNCACGCDNLHYARRSGCSRGWCSDRERANDQAGEEGVEAEEETGFLREGGSCYLCWGEQSIIADSSLVFVPSREND